MAFKACMIGLLLAVAHGNAKKWLLDWSEWEHLGEIATSEQKLRLLVNECAMRLELPGNVCEHTVLPHLDFEDRRHETALPEHYRVPSMESGDLPCGFERRMEKEAMESLASRYSFHFLGDSTTRRLGESFASIFTGEGSTHPMYHGTRDLSSGSLKVAFYWAPKCSGREGVRAVLKTVLDAAEKDVRHPVIITAFGVHESAKLVTRSDDATPQVVIEEDGLRIDSLGACRDTTLELIRTAAADPSSKIHGENVGQQGRNVSTDMDTSNEVLAPSSPLVFLLQNNRFPSDSAQDLFLEDVQRIQRQEVDAWEATHTAERGIFVVNDSVSLYGNLSCFRNANPIHFHEPVKLVEGKMLWDLLALVGRY